MNEVIGYLTAASNLPKIKVEIGTFIGDDKTSENLHLYYTLSDLQDEIEKRTSYLGKLRATEQAQHLLDLIAMTKDEEDIFESFAAEAAADVFDIIAKHTKGVESAYSYNKDSDSFTYTDEDGNEVTVDCSKSVHYIIEFPNWLNKNLIDPLDAAVKSALVNRIIYKWLLLAYKGEAEIYLALYAEAADRIADRLAFFSKPAIIVSRPF